MIPGFSFVDKIRQVSNAGIYFVQAQSDGKRCWYYLEIDKLQTAIFKQKIKLGHKLNFSEYGKIIVSGWGREAPLIVVDKVDKLGAAYDAENDDELKKYYKSKSDVYFVQAVSEGKKCYYYVAVDGKLADEFKRACIEENPDFRDYGNIIESGWGDPSEVTKAYMKEKYFISTPEIQAEDT